MAKLAIVFVVAFAFQATLGGVVKYEVYQKGGYLQDHVNEMQTLANDISLILQGTYANAKFVNKNIKWQWTRWAEFIDEMINKLQIKTFAFHDDKVYRQVIEELEQVRDTLYEMKTYTYFTNSEQLMKKFDVSIQTVVRQCEMLVWMFNTHYQDVQGDAYIFLSKIYTDCIKMLETVYTEMRYMDQGFESKYGFEYGHDAEIFGDKYYKHFYGLGFNGKMDKNVKGHFVEIRKMMNDWFVQFHGVETYEAKQTMVMYIYKMIMLIDNICLHLQKQAPAEDYVKFDQIVDGLRKIKIDLRSIANYGTFTAIAHLKTEFFKYTTEVVDLFETLFYYTEQMPDMYYMVVQKVFFQFMYEIREMFSNEKQWGYGFGVESYKTGAGNWWPSNWFLGKYDNFDFYKYESHDVNALSYKMQSLAKLFADHIMTVDVHGMHFQQKTLSHVRRFVQVLDFVLEKLQANAVYGYADNDVQEVYYKLKQIKIEFQNMIDAGIYTNTNEIKIRFAKCIQIVANELGKLTWTQTDTQYIKAIFYEYFSFLNNFKTYWSGIESQYDSKWYQYDYKPLKYWM